MTFDWFDNPPSGDLYFDNITFRRPIDIDNDGTPFVKDTTTIEWSDPVTFRLDTNDVNNDGKTLQLVQLNADGTFNKLLIDDISPLVNSGENGPFDTPGVGGLSFRSLNSKTVEISIIQRKELGGGAPLVLNRYDDRVTMRN